MSEALDCGIVSPDVDGTIIFWDEDIEEIVEQLRHHRRDGFKLWRRSKPCKPTKSQIPKRLIQYQDCDWTCLYLCEGIRSHAFDEFFSGNHIEEMSYFFDQEMVVLELGDTAGIYNLEVFYMGNLSEIYSTDRRKQARGGRRERCEELDLSEIDQKLKDLGIRYSQVEDGGFDTDGSVLPLDQIDPYFQFVKGHDLLV